MRLGSLLFVMLCLAGQAAQAAGALPVTAKKIEDKSKLYDIAIAYPETGNRAIDDDIAVWAQSAAADFRKLAKETHQAGEQAYVLDTTFTVARNDASVFAVFFEEYTDTGGAHPNQDFATANYLMPDGWRIYLPEIFDGSKALARISNSTMADLDKRIGSGPDAMSDPDTIKMGAGADWDNFKDFVLMPKTLVIHFPPYQVAGYAAGPQVSSVALSDLRDVTRGDPRAPAASFDCKAAKAAIEQTICSSAALARLDRQVAESYALHQRDETDAGRKTAMKSEQRDWLGRRDAACAGQTGAVACLSGVYRERLGALEKLP
jgi:peptidoglycan-N-acetylglucosamine deacetylase